MIFRILKELWLEREKETALTDCQIKIKIFYFIDNLTVIMLNNRSNSFLKRFKTEKT